MLLRKKKGIMAVRKQIVSMSLYKLGLNPSQCPHRQNKSFYFIIKFLKFLAHSFIEGTCAPKAKGIQNSRDSSFQFCKISEKREWKELPELVHGLQL
jgi:hypothetical protein